MPEVRQGDRTCTQTRSRKRLLTTQGEVCAFTGPTPALMLEAAHPYSYAEEGRHHDQRGLLLRSDVHRLFDLRHVCVAPETGVLELSDYLVKQPCNASLHGQAVHIALHRNHQAWLPRHWNSHRISRA
ncbi:HNH endonuclease signature motif containing protein [Embleya sp. NPDC020630]|uniref:HNH endonuclease signature motif containing protein n=1 Tax=Embleya sp. NPDC020630 TaxID=3363979 RepID=UPI0037938BB5